MADPDYASAISGIESGGRYDILGPETKGGDRAYGKYQVMASNIPEWSQAALGQSLTPEQFLASPEAQDAVFQHRFGQYVQKYGPEGAARAWFAGEKGMNNPNAKDVLGTTVAGYGAKFMRNLGQGGAAPTPDTPGAPLSIAPPIARSNMPAFPWSPQGPGPSMQSAGMQGGGQPMGYNPGSQFQAPQMNAPPIYYAPRQQPQLASLQQFLQTRLRPGFSLKG